MADDENIVLKWNEDAGKFEPVESEEGINEGIFLELKANERKWIFFYISGVSMITKLTALRAANGISKTGFVHPSTGIRLGVECKLDEEVSPFKDIQEYVQKSQRD